MNNEIRVSNLAIKLTNESVQIDKSEESMKTTFFHLLSCASIKSHDGQGLSRHCIDHVPGSCVVITDIKSY